MPDLPSPDPRDRATEAASALRGLYFLLSDRARDDDTAALVGLICDRLEPAVEQLQSWQPRD